MDQRQFEATLSDAEIRLRRLRTLYDQWFHGLERSEPQTQRVEIDRLITELRRAQPRNTALRFRFNQLVQRYTSYNTYWQRITRQIEEGTYKRDVLRARRRFGERDGTDKRRAKDGYELDLDIDIEAALDSVIKSDPPPAASDAPPPARTSRPPPNSDRPPRAMREITPFALPSQVPPSMPAVNGDGLVLPSMPAIGTAPALRGGASSATRVGIAAKVSAPPKASAPNVSMPPPLPMTSRMPPPVPAGASRRPAATSTNGSAPARAPAPSASGPMSDEQIQGIYARYVEARKQNKERTDNVKIENVAKTVRDMLPKLEQKHAGKKIDFEVVVKDGRVALKPVAK